MIFLVNSKDQVRGLDSYAMRLPICRDFILIPQLIILSIRKMTKPLPKNMQALGM